MISGLRKLNITLILGRKHICPGDGLFSFGTGLLSELSDRYNVLILFVQIECFVRKNS